MIDDSILDLNVYLTADYSQIEIRMLAEISGDPLLIKQFQSGKDIHCLVGSTIMRIPENIVAKNKEKRKGVKNLHFGIVYGLGDEGMYTYLRAKGVKITRNRTSLYRRRYFQNYKGVAKYIDRSRAMAEKDNYVENLFGFARELGEWDDDRGSYWGNQAINTPIQGSAHYLTLIAMALVGLKPKTYKRLQRLVMEIHDALCAVTKLRNLPEAYKSAKYLLEEDVRDKVYKWFGRKLRVPLLAEAEAGFRLGTMVEYKGEKIPDFLDMWRSKYREVETKILKENRASGYAIPSRSVL